MRNTFKEKNSGITLIALVVTIIVLLLLAGISLAMLTGPNGLINKATRAGKESIIAEQKEKIIMAYNDALTSNMGGEVTADDIRKALNNNGVSASVGGTEEITVTIDGNTYTINQNGDVAGPTLAEEITIVEIITDEIGITNEGKVVRIGIDDSNWNISNPWAEVVIEEELDYINGVKKKFCGGSVNFIIDNDNNVYSFGRNAGALLGIGYNGSGHDSPQLIPELNNVVDIYMNGDIVIAKTRNGELYSWGNNYYGQLGIGNEENQNSPQQIAGLNNVVDIYMNRGFVIAKTSNGELYSWGNNGWGQLGIGNEEDQNTPQQIAGLNNVVDVYTKGYAVIAKTRNGELYSWGKNNYGQLGIGNNENQNTPQQITGLTNIDYILYRGEAGVIAKTKNGELYTWGDNEYGQLGIGNNEYQDSPQKITGLNNVVDIYIEEHMVIAKTRNGELYSWGENEGGKLGIGNNENQNSPQNITGINNVDDIYMIKPSNNTYSVIVKTSNGELYSWGNNGMGELGIGNTDNNQDSPVCINNIENIGLYGQKIIKIKGLCYIETEQKKWYKKFVLDPM